MRQGLGDKHGLALSLGNLGFVAQQQGDHTTARSLYERSLSIRRELGGNADVLVLLDSLASLALAERQNEPAVCLLGAVAGFAACRESRLKTRNMTATSASRARRWVRLSSLRPGRRDTA